MVTGDRSHKCIATNDRKPERYGTHGLAKKTSPFHPRHDICPMGTATTPPHHQSNAVNLPDVFEHNLFDSVSLQFYTFLPNAPSQTPRMHFPPHLLRPYNGATPAPGAASLRTHGGETGIPLLYSDNGRHPDQTNHRNPPSPGLLLLTQHPPGGGGGVPHYPAPPPPPLFHRSGQMGASHRARTC